VPLSTFFSIDGDKEVKYTDQQRSVISRWFWRACFAKRYSSGLLRNLNADVEEMHKLRAEKPSNLGGFAMQISDDVFTSNIFTIGTVNTNALVLLLAHQKPLSFVSGAPIDLGEKLRQSNRTEFHHLMPKAFVQSSSQTAYSPNCLANFAFISRADNRALGGVSPSTYRKHMPDDSSEIFKRSLCPETELMSDNLEAFIKARATLLRSAAEALCV
jgi:hypothetical protein